MVEVAGVQVVEVAGIQVVEVAGVQVAGRFQVDRVYLWDQPFLVAVVIDSYYKL